MTKWLVRNNALSKNYIATNYTLTYKYKMLRYSLE